MRGDTSVAATGAIVATLSYKALGTYGDSKVERYIHRLRSRHGDASTWAYHERCHFLTRARCLRHALARMTRQHRPPLYAASGRAGRSRHPRTALRARARLHATPPATALHGKPLATTLARNLATPALSGNVAGGQLLATAAEGRERHATPGFTYVATRGLITNS